MFSGLAVGNWFCNILLIPAASQSMKTTRRRSELRLISNLRSHAGHSCSVSDSSAGRLACLKETVGSGEELSERPLENTPGDLLFNQDTFNHNTFNQDTFNQETCCSTRIPLTTIPLTRIPLTTIPLTRIPVVQPGYL